MNDNNFPQESTGMNHRSKVIVVLANIQSTLSKSYKFIIEMKTLKNEVTSVDKLKEDNNELVFSYLTLRNLIGFGGVSLPIALAIFPSRDSEYYGFEPSISDYFYTDRGDILVVILCVLGAFLITYSGYNWKERLLTFIAGIGSIGVAFVPTIQRCKDCLNSVHTNSGGVFPKLAGTAVHFIFAATFLFVLAILSLVFFTKGRKENCFNTDGTLSQKGKRNIVFKVCGWIIIACLAILGLYFIFKPDLKGFPVIYVFESIAVEAFGLSWLTKGQTLWSDGEHYLLKGLKGLTAKR